MLSSLLSGSMSITDALIYVLSALAVIFLTMPIHELAHAFVGVKLGDNTPRYQGRYTINPFAHIDYLGALCIILFRFGWAKPVQINHNNLKNPKRDMALVALAGPLANLLMAFISFLLFNAVIVIATLSTPGSLTFIFSYIINFFLFVAEINVYLAVFNLIPIPPLDGSRILTAFLPYKAYYTLMRYERYIYFGLIAILYLGILDVPLNFLSGAVSGFLYRIAELPFKFLG